MPRSNMIIKIHRGQDRIVLFDHNGEELGDIIIADSSKAEFADLSLRFDRCTRIRRMKR